MRLSKTDFRFLFYTPKNMHFQKKRYRFFNAHKVKKKNLLIITIYIYTHIYMYLVFIY